MKRLSIVFTAFLLVNVSCSKQEGIQNDSDTMPVSAMKAPGGGSSGVVTYLTGDAADVSSNTTAGLVLMGGSTDVDAAFAWMIQKCGGGDAVVIRSTGADGYNAYMFDMGGLNSVETIMIDSRTKAADGTVIDKIRNAEMLFIAGGDQWDYVNYWKNTPVEDAINYLINSKKVPVGGTSAGLAILGATYFSASAGTITSDKALADPYNRYMTLGTNDFINAPFMSNTITDSHYSQRTRQGRHIAFMAKMMKDWNYSTVKGIGVDEETAVCVEANGVAKVFGNNKAFFLINSGAGPETCIAKQKLTWSRGQQAIKVYSIPGSATGNGSFDLNNWTSFSGGTSSYYYVNNGILF